METEVEVKREVVDSKVIQHKKIDRTPREAGGPPNGPKPARSRHCVWGVSLDPAREPLGHR